MTDIDGDIETVANLSVVRPILDVVAQTTGMGFAAVARVTDTQWVACAVRDDIDFGLKPGGELKLDSTICHEIRQSRQGVVFDDAQNDPVFRTHHTPALYGLRSYISMPIILGDGRFFGTLCAVDPRPAQIDNPRVIGMFILFADLIARHIDAQEQMLASQAALADAATVAALREQFIAVLGHDLRNPVAAITAGASILKRATLSDRDSKVLAMMAGSADRISELIDNILDFARGRMGVGVNLDRRNAPQLEATLAQVIAEVRAKSPDRAMEIRYALSETVWCDDHRIAQLFSNLLANAVTHGAPDRPIVIEASSDHQAFQLSVSNGGVPIPPDAMPRLFRPFVRGDMPSETQGLGLGLYIASEIAKSHGGTLEAISNLRETRFTLTIPSQPSGAETGVTATRAPALA